MLLMLTLSLYSHGQFSLRSEASKELLAKIQLPIISDSDDDTYFRLWGIKYDSAWLKSFNTGEKFIFISDEKQRSIIEQKILAYKAIYNDTLNSYFKIELLTNKGICELAIGRIEDAKKTFDDLFNVPYDTIIYQKKSGRHWDGERHEAAQLMAIMAMAGKNYKAAIKYLGLARKYPTSHWGCGNCSAADRSRMTYWYATCYIAMDSFHRAQEVLLPSMLPDWLESNDTFAEMLYPILRRTYSRDTLITLYESAFKNYTTELHDNYIPKRQFYINFLNTKINVYVDDSDRLVSKEQMDNRLMAVCQSSVLYKHLHEK